LIEVNAYIDHYWQGFFDDDLNTLELDGRFFVIFGAASSIRKVVLVVLLSTDDECPGWLVRFPSPFSIGLDWLVSIMGCGIVFLPFSTTSSAKSIALN
jgi:hypothetical protein